MAWLSQLESFGVDLGGYLAADRLLRSNHRKGGRDRQNRPRGAPGPLDHRYAWYNAPARTPGAGDPGYKIDPDRCRWQPGAGGRAGRPEPADLDFVGPRHGV